MSFNPTSASFFGAGYSLSENSLVIKTASDTVGIGVGGTFTARADSDVIQTASSHGLLVGDRVRVTQPDTPTNGLSNNTDYWVTSTSIVAVAGQTITSPNALTISSSIGGSVVNITADIIGASATLQQMGPLDQVSNSEATGDWRKVVFGIMEMLNSKWSGTPIGDRPKKLLIFRNVNVDQQTGETVYNYSVSCRVAVQAMEIVGE